MANLKILGNSVSIVIAPGTKKGMYLRTNNVRNTLPQRRARLATAEIAIANRGKSPQDIRAAVAAGMAGKNFGGPSKAELTQRRHARADATVARLRASI